jgi:hypothetical protein
MFDSTMFLLSDAGVVSWWLMSMITYGYSCLRDMLQDPVECATDWLT